VLVRLDGSSIREAVDVFKGSARGRRDLFSWGGHVVVSGCVCRRSRSRFFAMRVIPIPMKTHGVLSVSVTIRSYPKCSALARGAEVIQSAVH
jgi:hypothetical protein